MMKNLSLILVIMTIVISCSQKSHENGHTVSSDDTRLIDNTSIAINDEDKPLCQCSFKYLGKVRMNNRLDEIISGVAWNPEYYSCSLSWGEYIYNEFPPDTTISDFRIHLVDIDKLPEGFDSTFFDSKIFKTKLIATFSKEPDEKYRTCKFDPNNTGNYPKPKQWRD